MHPTAPGTFGVIVASLCACANGGAADEAPNIVARDAAASVLSADASVRPPDVADAGAAIQDADQPADDAPIAPAVAGAMGMPCTADMECLSKKCSVVHNGSYSAKLCTQICQLFAPCPVGAVCYGDDGGNLCVQDCTMTAACLKGQSCMPAFGAKGCLPSQ